MILPDKKNIFTDTWISSNFLSVEIGAKLHIRAVCFFSIERVLKIFLAIILLIVSYLMYRRYN